MAAYLIETALFTHGLISISDKELQEQWILPEAGFVWLEEGRIRTGTLLEYLPLRQKADQVRRFDAHGLPDAEKKGLTGALTASGTMVVCARQDVPMAVTCGMGGIGPRPGSQVSADLTALSELPVILVATAPKDVFDLPATIAWLKGAGVRVVGCRKAYTDGFLTKERPVHLDGRLAGTLFKPPLLILNGLPDKQRILSRAQLARAMDCGEQAKLRGQEYHPAVNNRLDELSGGVTARIQLHAIIENAVLATSL